MEDIDIKNFQSVSSVSDGDSILLTRGNASGSHGKVAFPLFCATVSKGITPSIVDGVWHVGGTSTGVTAQGEDGKTPVFSSGTVTTGLPDTGASAEVRYDGINESGNPIYVIDFTIPAGRPGQDGGGAGNVYVNNAGEMESGKLYLFQPGADGMVNGYLVEYMGQDGVGQEYPGYTGAEIFNDYGGNTAAGLYAHAEGRETSASGPRAHAEGYKARALAADAHSEGRETWNIGPQSHAEGMNTICIGGASHVEGAASNESGGDIPDDGSRPVLLDDEETIRTFVGTFGKSNGTAYDNTYKIELDTLKASYYFHLALGERSHAEGANNFVCDNTSHVEGFGNVCGDLYFAHGASLNHKANHVEGYGNTLHSGDTPASQNYGVHIEGRNNTVFGYSPYSHVGGHSCTVGTEGGGTPAMYAFAHGFNLTARNNYEAAFGRYNLSEQGGKKVLFSYGTGTSASARQNAFAVLEDGTVYIPKLAGAGADLDLGSQLQPLYNRINNIYNELSATIKEQQAEIDSLTAIIAALHPQQKVFVVGDRLVMTSLIDAAADGGQLSISDTGTKVEGGVLVFGEYDPGTTPDPPEGGEGGSGGDDGGGSEEEGTKAYVISGTLYLTEGMGASVSDGTLVLLDGGTEANNGILTING